MQLRSQREPLIQQVQSLIVGGPLDETSTMAVDFLSSQKTTQIRVRLCSAERYLVTAQSHALQHKTGKTQTATVMTSNKAVSDIA